ncbi:hypothetical protein J2755_000561 [Methanohalophilus levihalophilus]|uniref:DUF7507 domain-containing protein n=1 Tax=Methanohalophilus levihalophilus TaxID=1431282 RepID=UPI001AE2E971|nr:VPXXXP-CTERM sorting domain-containing protein [Methanohalophilus levihalophilus]MBP2029641.1 hypothetical protein [Methanohalophilus levihalophilus]
MVGYKILLISCIALLLAMSGMAAAESWNESDFSQQEFGINLTLDSAGDNMTWYVNLSGIDGHWSTGTQLLINNSSQTFMLGRSPAEGIVYKEYNGGWSSASPLPEGMAVIGAPNSEQYIIVVSQSLLGNGGEYFCWAINVEATWPGHTSSVQQQFPADWGRWSSPDENMTCTMIPIDASLDLEKSTNGDDADEAPGPTIPRLDDVTWTYNVTNTGNINLTNVTVTDDMIGLIGVIPLLMPGESMELTEIGIAQFGQYENNATAVGTPAVNRNFENGNLNNHYVMDYDLSHYFGYSTSSGSSDIPTANPLLVIGGIGLAVALFLRREM